MKDWWEGLDSRERLILLVGGIFVAASLLYGLLWVPLAEENALLRTRRQAQMSDLLWMQETALQVKNAQRSGKKPKLQRERSLLSAVDVAAKAERINKQLGNVTPEGENRVRVQLTEVNFDRFLQWLERLSEQGIRINSVEIQRQEKTPKVTARLLLERPDA